MDINRFLNVKEPWVVYRSLIDLYDLDESNFEVIKAKTNLLSNPLIKQILQELDDCPKEVLSSHKSAKQWYHKLNFLVELGLNVNDANFKKIISNITTNQSAEGIFLLPMKISKAYGGDDQQKWAWALCDAPILLYIVAKADPSQKDHVFKAINHLLSLKMDNGWPCVVSKELGNFRGPGKKSDICPYANLILLKLFTLFEELKNSIIAKKVADSLLSLFENSLTQHPYMFYMGNDFRKLKAPFIWYDIMHVVDVLSHFDFLKTDKRFLEMVSIIHQKQDLNGFYQPESVWLAWNEFDFGQKKEISNWLTFLVARIDKRIKKMP